MILERNLTPVLTLKLQGLIWVKMTSVFPEELKLLDLKYLDGCKSQSCLAIGPTNFFLQVYIIV